MKKYLVVGFCKFGLMEDLAKVEPDVILLEQREIKNADTAKAIIDLVKSVDAVVFTDDCNEKERLCYEVAIAMYGNVTAKYEISDFIVPKPKVEKAEVVVEKREEA